MKLQFNNTEKAFAHKSTNELRNAKALFQTFNYKWLVKYGPSLANTALKLGLPIKPLIKSTLFYQFCGGENLEECDKAAKKLYDNHLHSILDYSAEGEKSEESFEATFEELKKAITHAAPKPQFPFAVFKCTGIGSFDILAKVNAKEPLTSKEASEYKRFVQRFETLCALANEHNIRLFVDAEETWIQHTIDDLVYTAMAKYNKNKSLIFNTIQLYRTGRIAEIQRLIAAAKEQNFHIGLKLVRGAYMEKERARATELGYTSPIQATKDDTDKSFDEALKICFEHRDILQICAGTHNEASNAYLAQMMTDNNVQTNDNAFWFAQLYGMSDHISYNLAAEGFNVAKYLPYGPVQKVLPYLSRRAQENSSVKGQAGRELQLINNELRRRKK